MYVYATHHYPNMGFSNRVESIGEFDHQFRVSPTILWISRRLRREEIDLVEKSKTFRYEAMITRSNLAEQLREYQIRSKHDWASVSFFSSTSSFSSSR
ncbi:unnamed protein product [Arabis nemorensis]|uniref:Uncharacterized protein n=1 Tax=Arabis nemorensis TaxID=586526 RepID=A0A565ATT1_9BRAS|nr:unnamed protein product [Arabis nemorensis]